MIADSKFLRKEMRAGVADRLKKSGAIALREMNGVLFPSVLFRKKWNRNPCMLQIDFEKIQQPSGLKRLLSLFRERRQVIYDLVLERLRHEGPTKYTRFVADHPDGQARTNRYLDAFEEALRGNIKVFFDDQQNIGYVRALEGYNLEDVFTHKMVFKKILLESIDDYNNKNPGNPTTAQDLIFLDLLLDYSNYLLSSSFLKTRDELINRRRKQFEHLHAYAAKALPVFNASEVEKFALEALFDIFQLNGFFGNDRLSGECGQTSSYGISKELLQCIERHNRTSRKMACIDVFNKASNLQNKPFHARVRVVWAPVAPHGGRILVVHNHGLTFLLERHERNLFFQFCIVTRMFLDNCLMVKELSGKERELRNLAQRLIVAKEEEDRRIEAEIHDTVTQALTAIGYKALLCRKLASRDMAKFEKVLSELIENTNEALKQCRHITSNLQPRTLNDLGLSTTFRRLINEFRKETRLHMKFSCPKDLMVTPEVGIALFRILQEALRNVKKHAHAKWVDVKVRKDTCRREIYLTVKDNGKGKVKSGETRKGKRSGIGLLIMREWAENIGGKLEINSEEGKGFSLKVIAPMWRSSGGGASESNGGRRSLHCSRRRSSTIGD